jgi:hypothetical protein
MSLLDSKSVCQIQTKARRQWVTICSFAYDENLNDIITVFEVNYDLKKNANDL